MATTEPKARRSGELPPGFSIMAKPTGPACNLNCEYCFYLEKDALFPDWGGGAYAEVVLGGVLRVGDEVSWIDEDQPTR